ncbi:hypothetical protein Tco_1443742, partial [Tanacetum coccineum]
GTDGMGASIDFCCLEEGSFNSGPVRFKVLLKGPSNALVNKSNALVFYKINKVLKDRIGSDDYHQILDFLRASHIRSPELADDGGIDDLPIAEIYSGMDNLGYVTEGKLTFYKNKFSPQWRFLVHTILHCLSAKSGSWDQFGSSLLVALLNFEGQPMQLLAAMLPQDQEGEGAGPQDHLSTPPRQQTSDPFTSTNVEDEPYSPYISTISTKKVNSLETELKAHKKLFKDVVGKLVKKVKAIEVKLKTKKRKVVVSDFDQEEGGEQAMDLDALIALANAVVTVDSNIPPGGASNNPAASSHIPTDVPTSGDFAPTHS